MLKTTNFKYSLYLRTVMKIAKKRVFLVTILFLILVMPFVFAEVDKIRIALDKIDLKPGESLTYTLFLYDENNQQIEGEVRVEFNNAYIEKPIEKSVQANKPNIFQTSAQEAAGYWKIIAYYEDKQAQEIFSIEEIEKAEFEIIENILILTNVGNVPYKENVQIIIGENILTKEVDLEVGDSRQMRLVAPDGNYLVRVSDGKTEISKDNVALTGSFIEVFKLPTKQKRSYFLVWAFLAIIAGLFVLMTLRNFMIKKQQNKNLCY